MEEEYAKRLLIYLKQELPEYSDQLAVKSGRLIVTVPPDAAFAPVFEHLFNTVDAAITRIRNRKTDIEFTVRSPTQERDFKILKL